MTICSMSMSNQDYEMDISSNSINHSDGQPNQEEQSHYSLFFSDSNGNGNLRYLAATASKDDQQHLPSPIKVNINIPDHLNQDWNSNLAGNKNRGVMKMAEARFKDSSWIIALARKDGTIDIVRPDESLPGPEQQQQQAGPSSSSTSTSPDPKETNLQASRSIVNAELLTTIKESRMKAGIERWVGLAVAQDGIYACTSSGFFSFTPLEISSTNPTILTKSQPINLELPSPLQALTFQPQSNPTHFAFGGEEIPISLWDVKVAISPRSQPPFIRKNENEEIEGGAGEGEGNSKQKKRKRQAEIKAANKELAWGEIWRAKNLPNDYLSLPQRANITSVAFLCPSTESITSSTAASSSSTPTMPSVQLVVGTKDGLIRIFNPSSGSRKHSEEYKIIPNNQNNAQTIKTISTGLKVGELFVADITGKVFAVDWRSGKVLYSYKDINGAATSLLPLPSPIGSSSTSGILFSSSQDDQIRLHSTKSPPSNVEKKSNPNGRGQNLYSLFSVGKPCGIVWNGVVPRVVSEHQVKKDDKIEDDYDSDLEEENQEDELWNGLTEVGKENQTGRGAKGGRNVEDDDRDEEKEKESRSKRSRG